MACSCDYANETRCSKIMLRILWVDGEVLGLERGLSLHRDGS